MLARWLSGRGLWPQPRTTRSSWGWVSLPSLHSSQWWLSPSSSSSSLAINYSMFMIIIRQLNLTKANQLLLTLNLDGLLIIIIYCKQRQPTWKWNSSGWRGWGSWSRSVCFTFPPHSTTPWARCPPSGCLHLPRRLPYPTGVAGLQHKMIILWLLF